MNIVKKVSIIIPVYNERDNIAVLFQEILDVSHSFHSLSDIEVIFIDDGSTDGSFSILEGTTKKDSRFKVVSFKRNYGQTTAMGAGVEYASGDVIVMLDGDLQNDPADIPALLLKIEEGYDVVSGWRKKRHDGYLRVLLSRIANKMIAKVTNVKLNDYGCTLKAYRSEVIKSIDFLGEVHRLLPVYAFWRGASIAEIEVNHRPRRYGQSKYGFMRIAKVPLDLLVAKFVLNYSTTPIYFFGALGILAFILGFISFVWSVVLRFNGTSFIETPLLLLTVLLFVVGVQLVSMGILADMILRTRRNKKNLHPIAKKIGF